MTDKELLNKLVDILYNKSGNFSMCSDLKDLNQYDLQDLLKTPTKNKNLVKGGILTNLGYLSVKLTSTGINYYENGFKFDKEINEKSSWQENIKKFVIISVIIGVIIWAICFILEYYITNYLLENKKNTKENISYDINKIKNNIIISGFDNSSDCYGYFPQIIEFYKTYGLIENYNMTINFYNQWTNRYDDIIENNYKTRDALCGYLNSNITIIKNLEN